MTQELSEAFDQEFNQKLADLTHLHFTFEL